MPIHTMSFNEGVFHARTVGYVDNVDGRMWGSAFKQYARSSDVPIVAVMDLTDADRLCSTLPRVLSDVLSEVNIAGVILVVSGALASQNMRVFDKIDRMDGVRAVGDINTATTYANGLINPGFGMYTAQASAFSMAACL